MNRRGSALFIMLGIIVILVIVIAIGYFVWKKSAESYPTLTVPVQVTSTPTASSTSALVIQTSSSVNSSSLSLTNSAWDQIYVSSTGLTFSMPKFGVPYNIDAGTSAEESYMNVQLENASSFYVTEFQLSIYNNPTKLNLHDWFEQNVDDEGVLLAQNGYKPEILSNGSPAYVFVSSAPLGTIPGFQGYGPGILLTAFTQSTTTGEIIGVDGSQADNLYNYGFTTQDSKDQLQLSILGTAHF